MRYAPQILVVAGGLAILFGYWGVNTVPGRRMFDEMAGMIPWAVGVLGWVSLLTGGIWWVLRAPSA